MKKIPLTRGAFAIVDDEDYEMISSKKWFLSGQYAARGVWIPKKDGKKSRLTTEYMHHVIVGKVSKGMNVDHINGDKLDNRKLNLRICSHAENQRNQKTASSSSSGFKGVSYHKQTKRWRSAITQFDKQKHLGYFLDKREAALAYNKEAKKLFGEFACLNVIN